MRNTNEDHNAWIKDQKEIAQKAKVAEWLKANPEIGELNGGKFYKFEDGQQVFVTPPIEETSMDKELLRILKVDPNDPELKYLEQGIKWLEEQA